MEKPNVDRGGTEVRSHGEVGNGGGSKNGGREVVEGTFTPRDLERPDHGTKTTGGHHGEDSPKPVGTSGGDVDVGDRGVDAEGLIARTLDKLSDRVHFEIDFEAAKVDVGW